MASGGAPGPFLTLAMVITALVGGGGIYLAMPSHQHLVKQKIDALKVVAVNFEHKTEDKLKAAKAKNAIVTGRVKDILAKLAKGGRVDVFGFDGDGDSDHDDLALLEAAGEDDGFRLGPFDLTSLSAFIVVDFLVIALVAGIVHYRHKQKMMATNPKGSFIVTILRCNDLKNVDSGKVLAEKTKSAEAKPETTSGYFSSASKGDKKDLSDPFVSVHCAGSSSKTQAVKDNLDPTWKEANKFEFTVDCSDKKKNTLDIEVADEKESFFGKPKSLGKASISIDEVFRSRSGEPVEKTFPLDVNGEPQGTITIHGIFMPEKETLSKKTR